MIVHAVKFEFINHEYELLEAAIDEVYVHIYRECRLQPLPGMKQPTPFGSIMGLIANMQVLVAGQRANSCRYILRLGDQEIQSESIINGQAENLNIKMPQFGEFQYTIEILPIDTASEQTGEPMQNI